MKKKIKIGISQINNCFSGAYYLPYVAGLLESFFKKYELICKHPAGNIVRYPVSFNTFWHPHNMKGGIFRFETTDGRIVRSSFCHGEAFH